MVSLAENQVDLGNSFNDLIHAGVLLRGQFDDFVQEYLRHLGL